jgi:hypothetical protein
MSGHLQNGLCVFIGLPEGQKLAAELIFIGGPSSQQIMPHRMAAIGSRGQIRGRWPLNFSALDLKKPLGSQPPLNSGNKNGGDHERSFKR